MSTVGKWKTENLNLINTTAGKRETTADLKS